MNTRTLVRIAKNPRNGKPVTVISNIRHNPQMIQRMASELKSLCGTGGTVEGGTIQLQGDHEKKVRSWLESKGITPG